MKTEIHKENIIEWKDGSKDLVYALGWYDENEHLVLSDEVYMREATEEDIAWHKKKLANEKRIAEMPDEFSMPLSELWGG
tara:strand:+ start:166 stop:405 length:240 start_codon:yes stop_codon:yes gene_type:complete